MWNLIIGVGAQIVKEHFNIKKVCTKSGCIMMRKETYEFCEKHQSEADNKSTIIGIVILIVILVVIFH